MKPLTSETINQEIGNLKGWSFSKNAIEKKFTFKDFSEAISFMIRISYFCEKMNHHPEWTNVYNKLSIRLSTHDAGGVTKKDMDLAREIDSVTP